MELREMIAAQLGNLLLANLELSSQVAELRKTQSEGKAQAEEHLAAQQNATAPAQPEQ